jgi:hypothetical protein
MLSVNGAISIGPAREAGPRWWTWDFTRVPTIVIHGGAVVEGCLSFERRVKLYVNDRAAIGPVEGAEPIRFSGDSPTARHSWTGRP